MNILLLENDLKKNISIMKMLSNIYPNAGQYHLYSSFNSTQAYRISNQVTIDVFLISFEDDLSGITLAKQIRAIEKYRMTWLVYFSDNYNHIEKALETNCIDYILWPIDEKKLKNRLNKIIKYHLIKKKKPSIFIKHKGNYYNIEQDEIYYIEIIEKNLFVKTKNKHTKLGRIPIKDIKNRVCEETFFVCNRSTLLNTNKIEDVKRENGGWKVSFNDINENIYISNNRKAAFDEIHSKNKSNHSGHKIDSLRQNIT